MQDTDEGVEALFELIGWRSAREVVAYLRAKGARVAALEERINADWAAVSSEGEGDSDAVIGDAEKDEDLVWVPTGQ